jgi:predicted amidohydrolase
VNDLTLTLVQTATHWHDPVRNRAVFDDWFSQLPATTDLVVLPEMFSTGFTMASAEVAEPMNGPTVTWLVERAAELGKAITGSLVVEENGSFFNRLLWVTPHGVEASYDKRHRFRMAGEHEHYAAGRARPVVSIGGWRVLPFVCYDLRFPVWLRNRGDYDLLLGVANWPSVRELAWRTLLRARAIENLACVAGVNVVGTDGNAVSYPGASAVYGPDGEVVIEAGAQPGLVTCTLDAAGLATYRERFPAWQDANDFELEE